MPLKSFECAIARSQIGRYLAGDPVGDEAMRQLEAHITDCADCQRLIDSKKNELLGPLAGAPTAAEAVETNALATSDDVAEIERQLRVVAARSGRAVVEAVEAPEPEILEVRELVGAGVGAANGPTSIANPTISAMFGSAAKQIAPASIEPAGPELSIATTPAITKGSKPGFGAKFGKFSLPKLVRDVPEAETAPEAEAFGPNPVPQLKVVTGADPVVKAKKPLGKALVYGGALALVLGGMAFIGDPTSLLGGKAAKPEAIKSKLAGGKAVAKSGTKKGAKRTLVAKATGVRHSALGVPITDATDPIAMPALSAHPAAHAVAAKPKAASKVKTVAKAVPHDSADLGPLEYEPALDAPVRHAAAKHAAPKPHAKPAAKPKVVVKRAAVRKPAAKAKVAGPIATAAPIEATPAKAVRPTIGRRKSAGKSLRHVAKAHKPAPKSQNVIRVYDETGKPIN